MIEDWVLRIEAAARRMADAADTMQMAAVANEETGRRWAAAARDIPHTIWMRG